MNQYYNKKRAKLMEYVGGKGSSNRLRKLNRKRNNKIKHYFHNTSRYIADWCNKNNIDVIVIGKNKYWKNKINIGKVNNQNFVDIPFKMLIDQIEYKAEEHGIKTATTTESYTSKASFLDGDELPEYEEGADYSFSGTRTQRGLYKASDGTLINADVNGAYNIIRKVFPKAIEADGIDGELLHPEKINPVNDKAI